MDYIQVKFSELPALSSEREYFESGFQAGLEVIGQFLADDLKDEQLKSRIISVIIDSSQNNIH